MMLFFRILALSFAADAAFATHRDGIPSPHNRREIHGRQTIGSTPSATPTSSNSPTGSVASSPAGSSPAVVSTASARTPSAISVTVVQPPVYTYASIPSACPDASYSPVSGKYTGTIYHGLNVDTHAWCKIGYCPFRNSSGWEYSIAAIKTKLPEVNAIRLDRTMDHSNPTLDQDSVIEHLMGALPAIKNHGLAVVAGVYSGGSGYWGRFIAELGALERVLEVHGCSNIAVVKVGNNDLAAVSQHSCANSVTGEALWNEKNQTADILIRQMNLVRRMLRHHGCCDVPVTHTESAAEWSDVQQYVVQLIESCDSFVMLEDQPYWNIGDTTNMSGAYESFRYRAGEVFGITKQLQRDVWLAATGWPRADADVPYRNTNNLANAKNAQDYFNKVGCQVLGGKGSGFYHSDWLADGILRTPKEADFSIFNATGEPADNMDLSCSGWQANAETPDWLPQFAGGSGSL